MFTQTSRKLFFANILAVVFWMLLAVCATGSQSVTVGWNPDPTSRIAGYFLYYGTQSRTYTTRLDAGTSTQLTVPGLNEGLTYYFALTAYNAQRVESPPSAEITYIVPGVLTLNPATNPANPPNIRFPVAPGHWYEVQASTDLKTWVTLWQTATVTSNAWVAFQDPLSGAFPMRFYRLAAHSSSTLPPPVLQSVVQSGPAVTLAWNAAPGQAYQVQYGSGPAPTNWTNLGNVVVATGPSEVMPFIVNPGSQQSYRVVVVPSVPPPVFQSVVQNNGAITFSWSTIPGGIYQVQYASDLAHPGWKNIGGIINAFGPTATMSDAIGPDPQRFYRALLVGTLPPPMIQSMIQTNGHIIISWNSMAGQVYQLQYTYSLTQPYWQNLGNTITAVGPTTTASDVIGPDSQRFYRVALLASSPAPVIESVKENNGMILITWTAEPGQVYEVDYTSSLENPTWNYLTAYFATGYSMAAYDFIGPDPQRFYRIVRWQ